MSWFELCCVNISFTDGDASYTDNRDISYAELYELHVMVSVEMICVARNLYKILWERYMLYWPRCTCLLLGFGWTGWKRVTSCQLYTSRHQCSGSAAHLMLAKPFPYSLTAKLLNVFVLICQIYLSNLMSKSQNIFAQICSCFAAHFILAKLFPSILSIYIHICTNGDLKN